MGMTREIPRTALAITVTHVSNPSCMKIYHNKDYSEKLNVINAKLRLHMKRRKRRQSESTLQPKIGDAVIMHNRLQTDHDLSGWWVRGILGPCDKKTLQFNVFLVDHGYIVQAHREDFTIVPRSLIPDEHLSIEVGLCNIVPAWPKLDVSESGKNTDVSKSVKKWTKGIINIIKDCISASSKIYFDYLAVGKGKEKYGEMYLILEDEIVSLSEILVFNCFAIYLSKGFFSLMNSQNHDQTSIVKSLDDGVVVSLEAHILDPKKEQRIISDEAARGILARTGKSLKESGDDSQEILINTSVQCEPLERIEDARFPPRIHKVLKGLDIIALRRMQFYMWPAITKGLSILAVGPPNCGKTIGHVLPVVSSIASRKKIPKGNNPAILILCSSTSDVLAITSLCSELLEAYSDIRCVAGWNGRSDRSFVAEIYNGCQILVATPSYLMRFINSDEEHKKLINFESLSHLVIDGIDVILNKYFEQVKKLFNKHVVIGKRERFNLDKQPLQIVAVARHWSSLVSEFAKQCMTDPYICIGSYMEAAIFGRIMPKLIYITLDQKPEKVAELLDDDVSMVRTMIICGNSEEARALNQHISKDRDTLVACEKMMIVDIHGVREAWKASVSGLYPVLICTDKTLYDLNITDVDWLIHYSVALPSKTQFYYRFSTLMKNLKKGEGNCKVTIIIDDTNDRQLYGVVKVVEHCGTKIPAKFMDFVMQTVATLDRQKKSHPICDNVKAFGFCEKANSCPYRHCVLDEIDTPVTSIKIGDSVRLTVTYVHNATHFTARLMEYIGLDKKVTKYSAKEYMKISSTIQTYYADRKNRRCRRKITVGEICAVEESLDNFQRVKVLNITEKDYDDIPLFVELKCIDTGAILPRISVTRLMEIPENLANRDSHIVEVFLAGLVPYDEETDWNHRAIDDALNWFPDKTKPNSFVLGKVRLHLADTLWVDPLEIRTPIIGYPDLISASLKSHMIRLKHGTQNESHLPKLFELCRIGKVKNSEGEEIAPKEDMRSQIDIDLE